MRIEEAVELAPRTTLGVGGRARYFARAESEADLVHALGWASAKGLGVRVLGGGSNLVVADEGFDGLVLSIGLRGVTLMPVGNDVELRAAAGEPWDELVGSSVGQGLQGIECLSGIPGLVGATPIQNVGAYGQDVSESVVGVRALARRTREFREFSAEQCRFRYRNSFFKSEAPNDFIVVSVSYRLRRDSAPKVSYADLEKALTHSGIEKPTLDDVRQAVLEVRRSKSMVLDAADENGRSCGSFFVNPIVSNSALPAIAQRTGDAAMPRYPQNDGTTKLSAAWLIERAGFKKGTRDGKVGISTRHSLALVCHDGARAEDVVKLASRVRQAVFERFQVKLDPEPVFWGFPGDLPNDLS
jgi:UDP-N-acetylmuramate dehydrogenase